ncbi:MAG: hypothetical protein K6F94_08340 [Bacteroidaceae bacterium]|nr:hypothetical protein [Bacteroidaceae bacterium]
MTRIACNLLILPDGIRHENAIVTLDDNGNYVSWKPLNGEEAFVEWVRGTVDLSKTEKENRK